MSSPLDPGYLVAAIAGAVAITVALRALPFLVKAALNSSPLVADLGRWMPLGAVGILAVYCLSGTEFTQAGEAVPTLAGLAVLIVVHLWRHNALLSIVSGSATCLLLANGVF